MGNMNVKIEFKHGYNDQKQEVNQNKYIQKKFETFMDKKRQNGDNIYYKCNEK